MADNDLEDGELSVSEPSNMNSGIDAHKPANSSVPESSTRKKSAAKKEVQEKKTKPNGKNIETVQKEMLMQVSRKGQLDSTKDKEDRKNNINKTDAPAFFSANYKKVPCEFLKKGACTRGDQCTFSHDFEPAKSNTICRFFLGNACDKGDNCPFSHEIDSYPCKFYFVRQCDKHTLCPFSHEDHRFFKGEKETNQFFEENSDFMQESLRMNGNAGKLTTKYLYYLDQRRQKNAAIEADKSQSIMIPSSLGGSAQLSSSNNAQDFVENRLKFGQMQYQSSNQNSSQQSRFIENSISDNPLKYNNIPNNSHSAAFQGSNTGNPSINSLNDPRAQMMQRPPPLEKYPNGSNSMNQPFASGSYNNQQPPPSNISAGPSNAPPLGMYPHGYNNPSSKEFIPQNSFKQNPIKPPNFQGQYEANANYPSQGQKQLPLNPSQQQQYNHQANPQRYLSQQPLSHQPPQQTPQSSNVGNQYQPIHHYPSQQQQLSQPQQQPSMAKVSSHIPQQANPAAFQQAYGNPYGNNVFQQKEANIPPQTNGGQYNQGKPPVIQGIQGGQQSRIQPQNAPGNMYLGQLPQGYNQQPQMKQQPPSHMMQMSNSGSQIRQAQLGNPPINKGPQFLYGESSNQFPTSSDQAIPPGQKASEFYQAQQQQQQPQSAQAISTQVPYPSNSSQQYSSSSSQSSTYPQTQDQKSIPPPPRNAPLPPPGSLNIPSKLTIPTLNINKIGIQQQQQQQSFNGDNTYQQGGSSGQFANSILPPSVKASKIISEKQETANLQKELQSLPPLSSIEPKSSSQGSKSTKQSTQSPAVPIAQKVSNQKEGNASLAQEAAGGNSSDSQLKKKLESMEIQNQMNANKAGSSQKKTPSKELGSSQKDKRDGKSSLKNSSKKEMDDSDSLKQKEASNGDKQAANIVFKDPRQLRKLQEQMKKESATKGLSDVQFNLLERIEEEDSKNNSSKLLGKRKQYDSGSKQYSSDSIFAQDSELYDSGVKKFISERDNQKEVLLMRQQSDRKSKISKKTEEKDEPAMLIDRLKQLMMNTKKIPKPANKLEEAERKKSKLEYLKACLVKASSQLLIS